MEILKGIWSFIIGDGSGLITAVLTIGAVWAVISKGLKLLKEVNELMTAVIVALSDQKLTKAEVQTIIKEAKDIPLTIKTMLKDRK